MAYKTISFRVGFDGISPSARQRVGMQKNHNMVELEFEVAPELRVALQNNEASEKVVCRFEIYNAVGEVFRTASEDVLERFDNFIFYYKLQERDTRYGGIVKVVLVLTVLDGTDTVMESYSFPALLQVESLPEGVASDGKSRVSYSELELKALEAAKVAKDAADQAVEASDTASKLGEKALEAVKLAQDAAGQAAEASAAALKVKQAYDSGELKGEDGEDGFSPTVDVDQIEGGHRVTITDKNGANSFDVMDGQGGGNGETPGGSKQDYFADVNQSEGSTELQCDKEIVVAAPQTTLIATNFFGIGVGENDESQIDIHDGGIDIFSESFDVFSRDGSYIWDEGEGITMEAEQGFVTIHGKTEVDINSHTVVRIGASSKGVQIKNLVEPEEDQDAVNKAYVDAALPEAINDALGQAKASGEFDGKDGQNGKDGKDGYTPIKGVDYFDGIDGRDGKDGIDGYTPIKGVDYFDGKDGVNGKDGINGKDGASATHAWNGTTLTITSASGTSSANLKGEKGDKGDTGASGSNGKDGTSVTVSKVTESTADGGSNVVTFSDGKALTVKNGSKGSKGDTGLQGIQGPKGDKGDPYTLTDADKNAIATSVKNSFATETWTFKLKDGTTVTKKVVLG